MTSEKRTYTAPIASTQNLSAVVRGSFGGNTDYNCLGCLKRS